MKRLLFRSLLRLGITGMLARLQSDRALVITYHGFTDRVDHEGIENFWDLHLHVDTFREHLKYLRRHYNVIGLEQLVEHYRRGTPIPPNPAVITMDDGYRSNYRLAYPLLQEFECPATIFVATDFVDREQIQWTDRLEFAVNHAPLESILRDDALSNSDERASRARFLVEAKARLKRLPQEGRDAALRQIEADLGASVDDVEDLPAIYEPLKWSEIDEMLESGLVSIGSHTVSHYIVSGCTTEVLRRELVEAKRLIEERTGRPCPLFCYPNGSLADFDARSRAIVEEIGHVCALTTIEGLNGPGADVYELHRMGWFGQSPEEFAVAVSGLAGWIARLRPGSARAYG